MLYIILTILITLLIVLCVLWGIDPFNWVAIFTQLYAVRYAVRYGKFRREINQ